MINAKKLIEDLRKQGEEYDKDCGDWLLAGDRRNEILCAGKCTGIVQAINIVKNQPQVGTWIPVNERLPDKVIVICDVLYVEETDETYHDIKILNYIGGGKFVNSFNDEQNVIAWMPLPDPYQQEDKESEV